jgi:hypothetical protein
MVFSFKKIVCSIKSINSQNNHFKTQKTPQNEEAPDSGRPSHNVIVDGGSPRQGKASPYLDFFPKTL